MTDEEILSHYIDLSESDLTQRERLKSWTWS